MSAPCSTLRKSQKIWARFGVNDLEANALPKFEKRREQEHGIKAEDARKHVWYSSATPE